MKNIYLLLAILIVTACSESNQKETQELKPNVVQGETQGTTYSIVYYDSIATTEVLKKQVDSILHDFDMSLSNWEPASLISELNNSDSTSIQFDDHYNFFTEVFKRSREIFIQTNGAFDPTVSPLVNAWGFGFKNKEKMDSTKVDSLLQFVGFGYDNVRLSKTYDDALSPERMYVKLNPNTQLDFNAIAQGFSVDVVAEHMKHEGYKSFMIEIGGEVYALGLKPNNEEWRIGIDEPKENQAERTLNSVATISNEAIATSGNYRKFYEENGIKYAHTIDPKTGFPVRHGLLSATVVADACWRADAMATAFMVMGPEKSIDYMRTHTQSGLDVYFIYNDDKGEMKTYLSPGMQKRWQKAN